MNRIEHVVIITSNFVSPTVYKNVVLLANICSNMLQFK